MADTILACAAKQGLIDTRQVFTAGCSARRKSSHDLPVGAFGWACPTRVAPRATTPCRTRRPAMHTHGGISDVVIISSRRYQEDEHDLRAKGSFVVNCDPAGDIAESGAGETRSSSRRIRPA
jgi:hypothetical protein